MMRFSRVTVSAALFVFAGTILPAYAERGGPQGERQGRAEGQRRGQDARGQDARGQDARRQERSSQSAPQRRVEERTQQPRMRGEEPQYRGEQRRAEPIRRSEQPRVRQADRPLPQSRQEQRSRQMRPQAAPRRTREQAAQWQQQRGWLRQGGWQGSGSWQQNRARQWESEHRSWAQRGGYGGYYIPQDRFSLYFGQNHWFRMRTRPVIYMGYPRFRYGGFWFLLVDPWPEFWADDWYATDDVYIDYDDGYYLCNRRHPSFRLAITVAF